MFGKLLESRAERVRNRGGAVVSVVGHAVFIALAVAATRSQLVARGPEEHVVALPVLHKETIPRPAETAPSRSPSPSVPGLPTPVLPQIPDIIIPGIPPIDLGVGTPTEFSWRSDTASRRTGTGATSSVSGSDGIPFAAGVDKPAIAFPGNPAPRYPDILRRASIRGEVVVQVVIDTTGLADMSTLRIVSSDHPLFVEAVLASLPRARFLPAEAGGRKVRMWAVQSFVFEIGR
jgi:protein TonB